MKKACLLRSGVRVMGAGIDGGVFLPRLKNILEVREGEGGEEEEEQEGEGEGQGEEER